MAMTRFTEHDLIEILPGLRRYAIGLTGDPSRADDLVQDCFERALRNAERFEPGTNLKAWLFTILHNAFCSEIRRWKSRGPHVDFDEVAPTFVVAADQEEAVMSQDVVVCLERLSEWERQVLLLVGVEGLSYEEAARVMAVELGTVKSRLFRARDKFRRLYSEMCRPIDVVDDILVSMRRLQPATLPLAN